MSDYKVIPFDRVTFGYREDGSRIEVQDGEPVLTDEEEAQVLSKVLMFPGKTVDPHDLVPEDADHIRPRLNSTRVDVAAKRDEPTGETYVRVQVTEPELSFIYDLTPKQAEKVARHMIVMAQVAREERGRGTA